MDFWINPDNLTRIFWLGGLWVLLSVIWASASVWIASDSELIFGESSWPLASVCFGAVFFLVTVMWGLSATPIFAVGFIAALFFYTFTRDKKAPAQERILCVAFVSVWCAFSLGVCVFVHRRPLPITTTLFSLWCSDHDALQLVAQDLVTGAH